MYFSEVVLTELLAALRNYSRMPAKLSLISKLLFNIVIKIAKIPQNEKLQQLALQCLNNFSVMTEFDLHIKQVGGQDLWVLMKNQKF